MALVVGSTVRLVEPQQGMRLGVPHLYEAGTEGALWAVDADECVLKIEDENGRLLTFLQVRVSAVEALESTSTGLSLVDREDLAVRAEGALRRIEPPAVRNRQPHPCMVMTGNVSIGFKFIGYFESAVDADEFCQQIMRLRNPEIAHAELLIVPFYLPEEALREIRERGHLMSRDWLCIPRR